MAIVRFCAKSALLVGILILSFLVAVQTVAYDNGYIYRGLSQSKGARNLGISEEDLQRYALVTADFLKGKSGQANLRLSYNGQEGWFLNERELLHMQDVGELFALARRFTFVLMGGILAGLLIRARAERLLSSFRLLARSFLGALLIALGLAGAVAINFNRAFVWFHVLSFDNDLWQLDPATDHLITLLPESFFMEAALDAFFRASVFLLFMSILFYLLARLIGRQPQIFAPR